MALTYQLIASNTLGSNQTTVTFSSIPATYTDLLLKISARSAAGGSTWDNVNLRFNSDTATNYSVTQLTGNGASAASTRASSATWIQSYRIIDADSATANTFGSVEYYIPSYTISQNKPLGYFGAQETNATTAYMSVEAGLYRSTNAITSISLSSGGDFVTGSSFFLYGIKNS